MIGNLRRTERHKMNDSVQVMSLTFEYYFEHFSYKRPINFNRISSYTHTVCQAQYPQGVMVKIQVKVIVCTA